MKHLNQYINIRKNQEHLYQKFFYIIEKHYGDNYGPDKIEQLHKTIDKIGKCLLLDVTLDNIVKLLNTDEYKVFFDISEETLEKNDKLIHIGVTPTCNYILFQLFDFQNEKCRHIEVASINSSLTSFSVFSMPAYGNYSKQRFIEDFWTAGAMIDDGWYKDDVNKDEESNAISHLKNQFDYLLK